MVGIFIGSLFYSAQAIATWVLGSLASAVIAILFFSRFKPKLFAFMLPLIWMIGFGTYMTIQYGDDGQFGLFLLELIPKSIAAALLAPVIVFVLGRVWPRK